ncbi:MAG: DUF2339 domain-containing protein [Deltaproteobacteria bacterium]|nr:DUF2339 domain-containing protein [Deltaproteobacteria bacterium]
MHFLTIVIGVFVGITLFYAKNDTLLGGLVGGLLAFLLSRILEMRGRITALERELGRLAGVAPAVEESPARTVEEEAMFAASAPPEPDWEDDFDAEAEAATAAAPPVPPALRTATTTPAADKTPRHELWPIIISYFTGGNVVVRVGIIVLFFGVAFLLKYTAERNLIPIEFRLLGVSLGGLAILAAGWRLRLSRPGYALILQGGGVGVLYLVIFTAMRLYHLLPPGVAMSLLVGLSFFSATLSILQDARALAVIGISGGFLGPVLTSTGGGNHVMLFSFYGLLNGGILFIAWHKSWRELNLLGFLFTFSIGGMWGFHQYQPEMFASTEPFLLLFFVFYVAIGVLFAKNQPLQLKGYVDSTMVFGTPLVCFGLQTTLVKPYEYGIAWSALAMGSLYASLAWLIFKKGSQAMRLLIESFMALGVVFATIAIPLALDGRWTSAAWALEGSAIVWIGIRQQRRAARLCGLVLQLLAGLAFLSAVTLPSGGLAVVNGFYLGCLAVSLAGFFSGYYLFLHRERIPTAMLESNLAFGWALLWWLGAGVHEIDVFVSRPYQPAAILAFCSFTGLIAHAVGTKLGWRPLREIYKGLPVVMTGAALHPLFDFTLMRPSGWGGWASWPASLAVLYLLLYQDERREDTWLHRSLHPAAFLLLIALVSWETCWWVDHWLRGAGVWEIVTLGTVPALFVFFLSRFRHLLPWPVRSWQESYLCHGFIPVALYLWLGTLVMNLLSKGDPWPLPYVPFVNPLDLTQMFVFIALSFWTLVMVRELRSGFFAENGRRLAVILIATVFFWLNGVLIRTIHYWGGVPFHYRSLMDSSLVQTSLSIFWTLAAFALMFAATRKKMRVVWLVGAGLIGVVILKLFTIDLANTGTVERIVSFIGVGLICLLIGYVSPLPGRPREERETV